MAIDPRISMGAQAPNLQSSLDLFQSTLNNIQNRKMNAQNMAQNELMNPLRVQQAEQAVASNQVSLDSNRQNEIIRSIADFAPVLKPLIESGNNMGALQALQARKADLQSRGVDTTQTDEAIQEIMNGNPDSVLQALNVAEREAVNRGLVGGANKLTAAERERQALLRDAQSNDPVVRDSALRALGNLARAGTVTADERIARDKNLTNDVAASQSQIAGSVAASKAQAEQPIKIRTEGLSAAREKSDKAIETLIAVRDEIGNLDSAIKAIESGAESGKVSNWFPSFRAETLKLKNAASRLGLNVVSATTFGALSEGELKLAMDVAVPTDLQPEELKDWLSTRKKAKVKLADELEKMAIALGSGEMTSSEYLKQQKEKDPLGLGL